MIELIACSKPERETPNSSKVDSCRTNGRTITDALPLGSVSVMELRADASSYTLLLRLMETAT